ncbi:MAG: S8 family peptidase [Saprospiraceae bacterium]|nr:S8 family peptidase [Saprospiraceae bacterium]
MFQFYRIFLKLLVIAIFNFMAVQLDSQSLNYKQGELIVQLAPGLDFNSLKSQASFKRAESVLNLVEPLRKLGPVWNLWLLKFDYSRYNETSLINQLRQIPEILNAQRNHLIQERLIPNDPFFNRQWHHLNDGSNGRNPAADFDSEKAWDLTTGGYTENGDTIVICVIDDGVDWFHEDLFDNLWLNLKEINANGIDDDLNGYVDDFHGWNTYTSNDVFELGKHGTPVMGLIGGRGNNLKGISGVNWNVKIMVVAGGGDEANALESYAYPFLFRRQYNQSNGKQGAFVVATNSSWGADNARPEDAPLWCAIYDSLGSVGILNVASTTNQNVDVDVEGDLPTTCESDYLLAVTNMDDLDKKDNNSGYGKKSIDIGAYGESVYTTYINNTYRTFSGTSAACPQVSGAVGLIYSLPCTNLAALTKSNPAQAALEVKQILINSAKQNDDLTNITVSGGVMNIFQSLLYASPLYLAQQGLNSLLLAWESNTIYPINVRYRIKDKTSWVDTLVYDGNQLLLDHLEPCTEYELQIKNGCQRYESFYSPIRIYKTAGCCESPFDFRIVTKTDHDVRLKFRDPSGAGQITALLRLNGVQKWDTFIVKPINDLFSLENLKSCAQYELRCYSFCNNRPSPLSNVLLINTDGCQQCTDVTYCKRFRPSSSLEWLHSIAVDNIPFVSGNNAGYGNFIGSNQSYVFEKGTNHSVDFKAGYLSDSSQVVVAAWIDFNQDGFFDSAENFADPTVKFIYSKSYNLTIPLNAKTGLTRMRICMKYAEVSDATPLSCFQSIEFGEYEDYCVWINEGPCEPIQAIVPNSISQNNATFTAVLTNARQVDYAYRKLYDTEWNFGNADSRDIQLKNLDSCTLYEIQIQTQCNEFITSPANLTFRTPGTGCIIKNKDLVNNTLKVFPNPFSNVLFLENPEHQYIAAIQYYRMDGTQVKYQSIQSNDGLIHLQTELHPGMYWLCVHLSDTNYRIIKVVHE